MEQKNSRWYEKNVLVIGDSLTADGKKHTVEIKL